MIKSKAKNFLALALALAVFSTASLGVSAKSHNSTEKEAASINTSTVKRAEVTKPTPKVEKNDKKTAKSKVEKSDKKIAQSKVKVVKSHVKNGQLTSLGKKLDVIASDTSKLAIKIDKFIMVNTTGSAINITPSAITTTGSAISTTCSAITVTNNKIAFIHSTSGKLKALSNRLSAVEKSLKQLGKKIDKNSREQYKSLVSTITTIKANINKQQELLKTLRATLIVKTYK